MALNYVALTFTMQDAGQDAQAGSVVIFPTNVVTAAGITVVDETQVVRSLSSGSVTVSLVACDNTGTTPASGFWAYNIQLPGGAGGLYLVNYAAGASQRFDNLTPVIAQTTYGPPAANYLPLTGGTLTGWLAPAVATLTFVGSGTTLVNAALGNSFNLTLTASTTTIGNPSNPVDGQVIRFRITQGSGGSFTTAWGSAYDFGTGSAPVLSTTAGKVDMTGFEYVATLSKWVCLGTVLGN